MIARKMSPMVCSSPFDERLMFLSYALGPGLSTAVAGQKPSAQEEELMVGMMIERGAMASAEKLS